MRRILVVAPSWIGDTVLAQPLLKLLHARHADTLIDVLAPPWTLPLLQRMPEVRHAISSPFGHGDLKIGERRRLGSKLRATGYDQAIVLPNSFKSALVPFFAGIPLRTGYVGEMRWGMINDTRRLDKQARPLMVDRFAALAAPAGEMLSHPLPPARLQVADDKRLVTLHKLALDTQAPAVALCPGAEYGPAKHWPAAYFAELARRLNSRGCDVWVVGSGKEAALGAEVEALSNSACTNLCGKTSLDEAVDVLSSASLAVSNDSGLMHIAAALGIPLIALYGSSSPGFTPPMSDDAIILKLDLPCSPCFKRQCPLGHFNCMKQLTPESVFNAIDFDRICRNS
jgi:heptosyltransferase-2